MLKCTFRLRFQRRPRQGSGCLPCVSPPTCTCTSEQWPPQAGRKPRTSAVVRADAMCYLGKKTKLNLCKPSQQTVYQVQELQHEMYRGSGRGERSRLRVWREIPGHTGTAYPASTAWAKHLSVLTVTYQPILFSLSTTRVTDKEAKSRLRACSS